MADAVLYLVDDDAPILYRHSPPNGFDRWTGSQWERSKVLHKAWFLGGDVSPISNEQAVGFWPAAFGHTPPG